MSWQRAVVLINERAGTALSVGGQALVEGVRTCFAEASRVDAVDIQCFPKEELLDRIDAAVESDAELVVMGGGDGSIAAAATRLRGTEKLLGVLPLGTMNLFAKDLGLPVNWVEALDAMLGGEPTHVDVGEVNGRLFLNRCSIGFYPKVIEQWQHTRGAPLLLRYLHFLRLSLGWWLCSRRSYLQCEIDGASVPHPPTRSIFIVNNPYASVTVGPVPSRPALDTGRLGVYIAYHQRVWELIRLYTRVLMGRWQHDDKMMVTNASEMTVRAAKRHRQKIVVDGEIVSCDIPLTLRSHPGALQVLRPTTPVLTSPNEVPEAMASAPLAAA